MTDTQKQLLKAILLNPAEDSVRLEYADALEEDGYDPRAEFIRVQVELARLNPRARLHCHITEWKKPNKGPPTGKAVLLPTPDVLAALRPGAERRLVDLVHLQRDDSEFVAIGCECDVELRAPSHGGLPEVTVQFLATGQADPDAERHDELRRRERELLSKANRGKWGGEALKTLIIEHIALRTLYDRSDLPERCEEYTRGFVSHVTCEAEDFLRVADALIWNESMTDVCPECKGDWTVSDGIISCERCKDTGRVPRPMPDTAMPIERVTLTTDHRDIEGWEDAFRPVIRAEDGKTIWRCDRWRGIEFELPAGIGEADEEMPEGADIEEWNETHP